MNKKIQNKKNKNSSPRYAIGDLVACYTNIDTYKIVCGWITTTYKGINGQNMYHIRWSDIDENDKSRASSPVEEGQVDLCRALLQTAIKLDIWEGKEILEYPKQRKI